MDIVVEWIFDCLEFVIMVCVIGGFLIGLVGELDILDIGFWIRICFYFMGCFCVVVFEEWIEKF